MSEMNSGAADPVGQPAGETTGPVSAAPTNPMIPLSAIRPIAVEAIRAVTGAADVGGPPGPYLTDEMERVAAAAADHFRGVTKMIEQEPFGYFRPVLDGWEDCSEGDEGAVALYDRPQRTEPEQKPAIYPEEAFEMGLEALAYYTHPVDDTALLRQALEALETEADHPGVIDEQAVNDAITALRERLGDGQ